MTDYEINSFLRKLARKHPKPLALSVSSLTEYFGISADECKTHLRNLATKCKIWIVSYSPFVIGVCNEFMPDSSTMKAYVEQGPIGEEELARLIAKTD